MKSLLVSIALFLFPCWPASAVDQNCMNDYYRTKLPACVDAILVQPRQTEAGSASASTALVGFLAQLFTMSPAEKQRVLAGSSSQYFKVVGLFALHRAGMPDDAQEFANQNSLSAVHQRMDKPAPLATVRPLQNPGDNDLLIGAYMASGDTTFIDRILANFSSADDGMVSDALRIGLMKSKFGSSLTPKGRENIVTKVGCAKYQCKADPAKFYRVLTLSSAFWALQSLSQSDEGVSKTSSAFFADDPRLKGLLAAEQAAFGNYAASLAMLAAFKPDQLAPDGAQTYEAMSKAASAYESLEPARNVFAHIEALAKSGKPPK